VALPVWTRAPLLVVVFVVATACWLMAVAVESTS
jgi:hypothetical protein